MVSLADDMGVCDNQTVGVPDCSRADASLPVGDLDDATTNLIENVRHPITELLK
jgi:hypothetical protein